MINWDNYPSATTGGVYTWEKNLIDFMTNYEFVILNQISNPNCNGKYIIPKHVTKVIEVPIYGTVRYEEYCHYDYHVITKILRTTERVIKEKFLPLYRDFVSSMISDHCNTKALADTVIKLHELLLEYDGKKCLEHPMTWEILVEELYKEPLYRSVVLKESALMVYQTFRTSIQFLATRVPKVDIIHSSLAWFPALVAIYAKKESNCPLIVTEHGVAYREIILFHSVFMFDEPSKLLSKVVSQNIVRLVYSVADAITPVCQINKDWEKTLGADQAKIKVIYNGIDTSKFKPIQVVREDKRPTIVSVARINPYKDIICLIQAVKYAKQQIPDLQCLIYGTSTDLDYSLRCISFVKELQLEDSVKFMGGTKEPEKAFNAADVVVITSITEGFPFTIIEAMACGKAVVASDVGGVREALEGCGLLVRSRRPFEIANAVIQLIKDENLRRKFEETAVKKVSDNFTLEKCVEQYKNEYEKLMESHKVKNVTLSNEVITQ